MTAPVSGCWCCGDDYPDTDLVRLGAHPEVGVCSGCARFLKRAAVAREDEHGRSAMSVVRGGLQRIRDGVMARGWHQRGRLGVFLRWTDRHLP